VDEDIIIEKDMEKLEDILQNVTMAKLEKEDLKILRDKNLIKLFKLG
jgi:hypothetical protein